MRQGKANRRWNGTHFGGLAWRPGGFAEAVTNLGRIFAAQGKVDEAISQYHECLASSEVQGRALQISANEVGFLFGETSARRLNKPRCADARPRFGRCAQQFGRRLVRRACRGRHWNTPIQPSVKRVLPKPEDQGAAPCKKLGHWMPLQPTTLPLVRP